VGNSSLFVYLCVSEFVFYCKGKVIENEKEKLRRVD